MKCPECNTNESRVTYTRQTKRNTEILRRLKCKKCGHRFTTFERVETEKMRAKKIKRTMPDKIAARMNAIIHMKDVSGFNYTEIAKVMKVSRQRVHQIYKTGKELIEERKEARG